METREVLRKALNYSEDEYCTAIYEHGLQYAEHYTKDTEAAKWITETRAYWTWYNNQFNIIDAAFEQTATGITTSKLAVRTLRKLWLQKHAPAAMIAYPNKHVLERAWELMISAMHKEMAEEINHLQKNIHHVKSR